jgi:hypothetical protein
MAILTTSGRAALAAAIKQQTLHLALGQGDEVWDTHQDVSATFDADGTLETGFTHLTNVVVRAKDDPDTVFALNIDYTVNAQEGRLNRTVTSSIGQDIEVTVSFKTEHPPEPIDRSALLGEVGRRVVDEVHFVFADTEGEIVVPTGRYRLSSTPTNHLFIRVRFDFDDAATSIVREQGLFVGCTTAPDLPPGQKFFVPAQIIDPGILLVLQHSVPIVRQPSTRETFEFVVTF